MSTLGDLTVSKIDQTGPPQADEFTYVDISSIDNKRKRIIEPKRLPVAAAPSRARQRLCTGDVLVSMTRPNLNAVAIVPPELDGAVGSTGFHVLRALEKIEPRWLFFSVQTREFVESMSSLVQGALYPAVRPKDIRAFGIEAPALNEQRRIVGEIEKQFSRLDEAIRGLKRVKSNLSRYRTSVVNAACDGMLSDCGTKTDSLRLSTLGELSTTGRYGTSVKCSYENSGIPVLRIPNVVSGRVDLSDLKYAPASYRTDEEDHLVPGDLLVIRTNGSKNLIGRGAIILDNFADPHIFASYLIRFRLSAGPSLWKWISLVLESSATRHWIEQHAASSAGQHNVSLTLLRSLPIPFPDEATRLRMIEEVERCLSLVKEAERQVGAGLQRAARYRQAFLTRAFRP